MKKSSTTHLSYKQIGVVFQYIIVALSDLKFNEEDIKEIMLEIDCSMALANVNKVTRKGEKLLKKIFGEDYIG